MGLKGLRGFVLDNFLGRSAPLSKLYEIVNLLVHCTRDSHQPNSDLEFTSQIKKSSQQSTTISKRLVNISHLIPRRMMILSPHQNLGWYSSWWLLWLENFVFQCSWSLDFDPSIKSWLQQLVQYGTVTEGWRADRQKNSIWTSSKLFLFMCHVLRYHHLFQSTLPSHHFFFVLFFCWRWKYRNMLTRSWLTWRRKRSPSRNLFHWSTLEFVCEAWNLVPYKQPKKTRLQNSELGMTQEWVASKM